MYVHYWKSFTQKSHFDFGEQGNFGLRSNSSECCWLIPTWESYKQACEMKD